LDAGVHRGQVVEKSVACAAVAEVLAGKQGVVASAPLGIPAFERAEGTPDADEEMENPDSAQPAGTPDVDKEAGTPDVDKEAGTPDVDKGAGIPDVDKEVGIPDVDKEAGTPDVDKEAGIPDVDKEAGIPDDWVVPGMLPVDCRESNSFAETEARQDAQRRGNVATKFGWNRAEQARRGHRGSDATEARQSPGLCRSIGSRSQSLFAEKDSAEGAGRF